MWSLSKGILLRNIVFPSIIDSITLDPGEHVFYAGGRIHIAALGADSSSIKSHWLHIIGSLSSHRCVIFLEDPCDKCGQSSSMNRFVLRSFH